MVFRVIKYSTKYSVATDVEHVQCLAFKCKYLKSNFNKLYAFDYHV